MYCPKCGAQNPETGKFCRSCGTDLGDVSDVLSGKLQIDRGCTDRRGRPISVESASTKFFMGVAFLIISIILGVTGRGGGWWFWMLVPAFIFLAGGVAQYIRLRSASSRNVRFGAGDKNALTGSVPNSLPLKQTEFVSSEPRYQTGDLVPPSVTDSTTRHLEVNSEGETITLPKR